MKPKYHISPRSGFLNDPNGLAQFHGKYHAFYQWLPAVIPRGKKRWRHCISHDLIHWRDEGCVLEPTEWYEKDGCYSGSGIVAKDRYYLFYTGNVRDERGGRESYQCAAVSDDGKTFVKKGPVIYRPDAYTPHFRDPKVWEKDGRWWMLVGAQTRETQEGNVALFVSENLENWNWVGSILEQTPDLGYMCECPDLLEVEGQEFLLVSRQKTGDSSGFVFAGKMDYQCGRFAVEKDSGKPLDEGLDFYAPQSFADESGRRLLFGWLGSGEEEYQLSQPAAKEGWLHSLTIPRELFVQDGQLCQRPAEELKALRKDEQSVEYIGNAVINRGTASLELMAENLNGQTVSFLFGSVLWIQYLQERRILRVLRKKWDGEGYDEKNIVLMNLENIRVYLDQSTAEIFVNDGKTVFTWKAYFGANMEIRISSEQKIKITSWKLEVS